MKHAYGFFEEDESAPRLDDEGMQAVRIGIAFLLTAAARSDGTLGAKETDLISRILVNKLGLPASRINSLMHAAPTPQIENAINESISFMAQTYSVSQREKILALIWSVIVADGVVEDIEAAFASHVRTALGLSLEQGLRARKRAEFIKIDGFKEFIEAWQGIDDTKE